MEYNYHRLGLLNELTWTRPQFPQQTVLWLLVGFTNNVIVSRNKKTTTEIVFA